MKAIKSHPQERRRGVPSDRAWAALRPDERIALNTTASSRPSWRRNLRRALSLVVAMSLAAACASPQPTPDTHKRNQNKAETVASTTQPAPPRPSGTVLTKRDPSGATMRIVLPDGWRETPLVPEDTRLMRAVDATGNSAIVTPVGTSKDTPPRELADFVLEGRSLAPEYRKTKQTWLTPTVLDHHYTTNERGHAVAYVTRLIVAHPDVALALSIRLVSASEIARKQAESMASSFGP